MIHQVSKSLSVSKKRDFPKHSSGEESVQVFGSPNFFTSSEVREFRGKCCGAADEPVPESEQDIAYRLIEVRGRCGISEESVGKTKAIWTSHDWECFYIEPMEMVRTGAWFMMLFNIFFE